MYLSQSQIFTDEWTGLSDFELDIKAQAQTSHSFAIFSNRSELVVRNATVETLPVRNVPIAKHCSGKWALSSSRLLKRSGLAKKRKETQFLLNDAPLSRSKSARTSPTTSPRWKTESASQLRCAWGLHYRRVWYKQAGFVPQPTFRSLCWVMLASPKKCFLPWKPFKASYLCYGGLAWAVACIGDHTRPSSRSSNDHLHHL